MITDEHGNETTFRHRDIRLKDPDAPPTGLLPTPKSIESKTRCRFHTLVCVSLEEHRAPNVRHRQHGSPCERFQEGNATFLILGQCPDLIPEFRLGKKDRTFSPEEHGLHVSGKRIPYQKGDHLGTESFHMAEPLIREQGSHLDHEVDLMRDFMRPDQRNRQAIKSHGGRHGIQRTGIQEAQTLHGRRAHQ